MAKILLVEDEHDLAEAIVDWLADEYHVVEIAADGREALPRFSATNYDMAILDLMLPDVDGLSICRQIRQSGSSIPILMLTAKRNIESKEAGLDAGADDYLTKPFQLRELSARIRALLRRPLTQPTEVLQVQGLLLDRRKCTVLKHGQPLRLLPKEFAMLELFMRHADEVLSVDTLLDRVWGTDSSIVPETVRTNIKTLRKKIEGSGSFIQTVHGLGYRLENRE
jgi:DNA-binding response OmpR family regulator